MINDLIETWWNIWPLPSTELRKAIEVIEHLIAERDALKDDLTKRTGNLMLVTAERDGLGDDLAQAKRYIETLTTERDTYQIAADKMAGEHKIERDALGMQVDALAKDAVRYRLEEKPCGDIWLHAKQFSINLGHKASTDPIYKLMQESARIDAAIARSNHDL